MRSTKHTRLRQSRSNSLSPPLKSSNCPIHKPARLIPREPQKKLQRSTFTLSRSHFSTTQQDSAEPPRDAPRARRKVQLYQSLDPKVPYHLAHQWMVDLIATKTRKEDPNDLDILFVVQHEPVYTLGKRADLGNLKFNLDLPASTSPPSEYQFDVQRIGRGGDVTYHGPGQLTVYPILDLKNYKKDLHWYVAQLETVVLHTLGKYGIQGGIDNDNPGIWIGHSKVSAIGCQVKKWTTMHGFSFNVDNAVHVGFNRIIPCGLGERQVTTLESLVRKKQQQELDDQNNPFLPTPAYQNMPPPAELADKSVNIEFVADQIVDSFEQVFDVEVERHHPVVIDFYDRSLDHTLAQPRVWLRDVEQQLH